MAYDQLTVPYGNGLSAKFELGNPLRLNTMPWDFPERPDLIALADRQQRLDFLRDQLKSLCDLWDKLPRLFLDTYFRDIGECIRRNRSALDVLAAAHGGLFQPEDWCYAALCPLPQARLPTAPDAPIDFAFWTGEEVHAIEVLSPSSQNSAQRERRARLRNSGVHTTEIQGSELLIAKTGGLLATLPAIFGDFWRDAPLPSSPFRVGSLSDVRSV